LYLRKMTFIVIIGIIASFSIRAFGTAFPHIFKNTLIVKSTVLINTVFVLLYLLFWLVFYGEYISAHKSELKKTCALVIIGSFAVSVIYIKKLPFAFGMNTDYPMFFMHPYFDAVVPLISSAFHLYFFVMFKKSLKTDEKARLRKPILSIIIGNSLHICFHLIALFNFLIIQRVEWLEHMPRAIAVGTVPVIILAVCFMLYFYCQFYCFLGSNGNTKRLST